MKASTAEGTVRSSDLHGSMVWIVGLFGLFAFWFAWLYGLGCWLVWVAGFMVCQSTYLGVLLARSLWFAFVCYFGSIITLEYYFGFALVRNIDVVLPKFCRLRAQHFAVSCTA
ncbi:hypothetical protein U1Q18_046929 [Sarracenia purpurea var. burkii]